MLGHHWESAEGKIVQVLDRPSLGMRQSEHHYMVEVRTPTGDVLHGPVSQRNSYPLEVGTLVRVQVNAKTKEIRLDSSGSGVVIGMSVAEQIRASSADFAAPASTGQPGIPGVAGRMSIRVIGPGGQDLNVDPAEVSALKAALMSGDPVARRSAVDRISQIKAEAAQAGSGLTVGFPGAGSARTAEERLAILQRLLDQGLLSEQEFQAQRQRIINEI